MPLAVDASSPIRFTGNITPAAGITSASFTAPADTLIIACVNFDSDGSGGTVVMSVSDDGGLAWTERVRRENNESTAGGFSTIFTAAPVSVVARTVTVTWTSGSVGVPPKRVSAKVYVATGVDTTLSVDSVTASNEGGSATNNLTTTSVTPTGDGMLFVCDTEWSAQGSFEASSDLSEDTADYSAIMSVNSGYKVCVNGVGVTANLNAGGSGAAQHKWCQIIVREAAEVFEAAQIYPFAITQRVG